MMVPGITDRGVYHPVELLEYLDACIAEGIPNWKVAEHLGVPMDRVVYATGEGYPQFKRAAHQFSLIEMAEQLTQLQNANVRSE